MSSEEKFALLLVVWIVCFMTAAFAVGSFHGEGWAWATISVGCFLMFLTLARTWAGKKGGQK